MRIIIDIETNETENTGKIRGQLNKGLENTLFDVIKGEVEKTVENSHFVTDYFKGCKITRAWEVCEVMMRKCNIPLRGKYLDRAGEMFGVKREPKEHDKKYRSRILEVIEKAKSKNTQRGVECK